MFRMFTECYCDHVGMPVDFSNDVLGTLAPPRRSQIPMVRGIIKNVKHALIGRRSRDV